MTDYLARKTDFNDADLASVFDEVSLWAARFGLLLLDELDLMAGIRVLDVGCGNGFPLFELAHMHGRSCTFAGVDVDAGALARAAFKLRRYDLSSVFLVRADGAALPLADSTFDLIVSNLGVNNFEDAPAVFRECARAARPGARIALTTNLKGHMREFYEVYRSVLAARGNRSSLERLAAHESHRGTRDALCALVESSGFRVARVVEEEFSLRFHDGGAFLRHALIRRGFLAGWRSILDPKDEHSVFAEIEARLDAVAGARGELRTTVPMLYLEGRRVGAH